MSDSFTDAGDLRLRKRIRLLKTGLYGVDKHIDMSIPGNLAFFESLAAPGTELKLVRNHHVPDNPFQIDVYSMDDRLLGHVTARKCQTVARLMDAGFEVVAIVNESIPLHDSDYNFGIEDKPGEIGWSESSRSETGHVLCNLPYGIYLVDPEGDV